MGSLANKRLVNRAVVPPWCRTLQAEATAPGLQRFSEILEISSGLAQSGFVPCASIKL